MTPVHAFFALFSNLIATLIVGAAVPPSSSCAGSFRSADGWGPGICGALGHGVGTSNLLQGSMTMAVHAAVAVEEDQAIGQEQNNVKKQGLEGRLATSRASSRATTTISNNVVATLLVFAVLVALVAAAFCVRQTADKVPHLLQHSEQEEQEILRHDNISEDTYGVAITSLVRDSQMIANGSGTLPLRISRMALSLGLLFTNIGLQACLMFQIKLFCTAKWVHNVRHDYDAFELHMYGNGTGHTTMTSNGNHRGVTSFFRPERFESMDKGLKERVCNIPFSQPGFFMMVLFIWTLTCIAELKECVVQLLALVITMPTVISMEDALGNTGLDMKEDDADNDGVAEKVVLGLTWGVKAILFFCVLLPRLVITCVLLWLGCRWLAATNDFSELVLNAVALEFLLMLKDLLYRTLVPARNKRDLQNTQIPPLMKTEPAGYSTFLGTFSLALVGLMWVFCYVLWLQTVLPEYRWDVRDVCSSWLKRHYSV